jgi:uroporphyrinogen III methyltransferase / synthase
VSAPPRGRVVLVGAGPGAPDLITLRGAAALREADAVVYDALVSPELLALAPPDALRIDVGKRGHEAPTLPQEETTALLLRLAREGRTVVRLKGGDPYVFGRGGEEGTAIVEAGVPLEVVPGVSSIFGALAYAGIPVTDRRHGASFAVVTGHKDPTKVSRETRWDRLAVAADTLLVLMGMRNLEEIAGRLVAGGRAPSTPAAVVMNGTLPSQRVVSAPLGEIAARAREAGLLAPAVLVVGDVVTLRSALAWWERRPLFGRRVLVTRSEDQAGELAAALREAGAEPVVVPMIRLEALPSAARADLDAALSRLDAYDVLLLTSANALRFFAARARERGVALAGLRARVVCVGPATAQAALAAGLPVHLVPEGRFDAEGVLEAVLRALPPYGRRFLLPRSDAARDALPEGLEREGGVVDAVAVYRNVPAPVDAAALRARLVAGELDALTFTSPSTARRFAELLDAPARAAATRCVVAAIGPVTAAALRREGLAPNVVAERAGARELVAALAEHMAEP